MLKAAKLTLAALFVAGSCGLAAAQTGNADSGGVSTDKPANRDTLGTSQQQSNEVKGGAAMQQKNTGMQQKNTGMPTGATNPPNAGPDEAGTAKDTAGSGTQRNPAAQKQ
jgi:hypothetical protein